MLDRNLWVVFAVTLMAIVGVSSLAPIIPRVAQELGVAPERIGLLITAFTLPGVALTPVFGAVADRFGRKRVLVPCLLLFGLAGGACALAPSFNSLLLLRFLQGIGAAAIGSLNLTVIGDLYEGKRRAAAMGYNASVLSLGTAGYPAIGGALAHLQWRLPFALPLLAIPVALLVLLVLDNPEPKSSEKLGAYLHGTFKAIKSPSMLGLLLASLLTFVILFGSYLTYLPVLLRMRFDASAFTIGLVISTASLTTAIFSSQLGRMTAHINQKWLVVIAFGLYAVAVGVVPFVDSIYWILLPVLLFGAAQGINMPSIMTMIAGLAPMQYRGLVMSTNGMVLRAGQSLGPVLMGVAFGIWGLSGPFVMGAVFAVLGGASLFLVLAPHHAHEATAG